MSSTLHRKSIRRPVAVSVYKKSVAVLYLETNTAYDGVDHVLRVGFSEDGVNFTLKGRSVTIETKAGVPFDLSHSKNFKLSLVKEKYVLTFVKDGTTVVEAFSKDLMHFKIEKKHKSKHSITITEIQTDKKKNFYINYFGDYSISTQTSTNLKEWNHTKAIVISPRKGFFDNSPLEVLGVHPILQGIFVTYASGTNVGAVLTSPSHPHRIIWRSEIPMFNFKDKHLFPFGSVVFDSQLYIYGGNLDGEVFGVCLPYSLQYLKKGADKIENPLKRSENNPIISPIENHWEAEGTFNPAAILDGKEIHLIYRALGRDGMSRLGYAKSSDGHSIDKRSDFPIFELSGKPVNKRTRYDISPSGGGWSGCEDPRAVKIGNKVYVTYSAFQGWNSIRMTLTSIKMKDLRNENWDWSEPIYLSYPNEVHKNWVLFPEKINGKFAVLHSVSPEVLIDYIDPKDMDVDSNEKDRVIKSRAPSGGRMMHWDNKVRGAGPPPLKTDKGWLLLYHATDTYDPHKYKLGAMLLDLNDPKKVLFRSKAPILTPEMNYENEGKPGVVYASGAIIKDNHLMVFYGGGDRVVCVATVELDKFLKDLMNK